MQPPTSRDCGPYIYTTFLVDINIGKTKLPDFSTNISYSLSFEINIFKEDVSFSIDQYGILEGGVATVEKKLSL
jgi:hypothetical protein